MPECEKGVFFMYYQELLDDFVDMCREILEKEDVESKDCSKGLIEEKGIENKKTLTGIYLHGSMAMGCFNPEKSDIDLIVVIEDNISDRQKSFETGRSITYRI